MKNLKRLIEHIFTKTNMKIILALLIFVFFFVGNSFAQSSSGDMTMTEQLSYLMNIGISILSRGRVILAALAGKFMTNDFVYGTFLNLDSSLWNLWNIMKNLANFTLGFVLIFNIVKNLFIGSFGKESPIQNVKGVVIKTLLAGVLIQMSRFLIAVMIDLSTIGTAAVGALPSQFIVADNDFKGSMISLIGNVEKKVDIDLSMTGDIVKSIKILDNNSDDDVDRLMDTIMPSSESMVGPFIFLGASVFDLYDLTDSSKNLSSEDSRSDLFLSLGINGFVLFIFSLSLALIFMFNLFRVITLWVIIPLSPFIMMIGVFFKGKKFSKFLGDITDFHKVISLIFKPVFMTLVLSIVLIVMVLMKSLINANHGKLDLAEQNMSISTTTTGDSNEIQDSSLDVSGIASINLLHFKRSLVDILIYIICLILMVVLVKATITKGTGIKFIDDKISGLSEIMWGGKNNFGGLIGTAGVLPIGRDADGNPVKVGLGPAMNYLMSDVPRGITGDLDKKAREQNVAIREHFGIDKNQSYSDFDKLNASLAKDEWLKQAAKICINKGYLTKQDIDNDRKFSDSLDDAIDKYNKYSGRKTLDIIGRKEVMDTIDNINKNGTP